MDATITQAIIVLALGVAGIAFAAAAPAAGAAGGPGGAGARGPAAAAGRRPRRGARAREAPPAPMAFADIAIPAGSVPLPWPAGPRVRVVGDPDPARGAPPRVHARSDAAEAREARDAAGSAVDIDLALVRRVRKGDVDAYGELVRRHMRRAFSIAYAILGNREDAEDVVQEAFIRTLDRIDQLIDGRPFHPWFFRIVANRALSYRRGRAVRSGEPIREDMEARGPSPEVAAERSELRERLRRAVGALPERQRTILVLSDVEDMSSIEIGEILGIPAGTVRYHLHLARRALRELLGDAGPEGAR